MGDTQTPARSVDVMGDHAKEVRLADKVPHFSVILGVGQAVETHLTFVFLTVAHSR